MTQLARRQKGAVTRRQLLDLGFTRHQIAHRIKIRALVPLHPGVYLVGPVHPPLAHEAAALLACGPRAYLSHTTAARVWNLPVEGNEGIVVTVVGRWRRSLTGVVVHSIGNLSDGDLRRRHGLPVSSPSLTLLDLAGVLSPAHLASALNEARVQRSVTDARLHETLNAHPKRRGAGALRQLLESERGPKITRSAAELRALRVMHDHGIEPDASDVEVGPYRVDFWFERERVAVEVDGYRYHSTPKRFVRDRRKIAYLAARGIQVVPLTWDDLGSHAKSAMDDLRHALRARRSI